jgi:hypothetical protein
VGNLITATRSTQEVIEVWDAVTGGAWRPCPGHTGAVRTAFSQDGSRLGTTGNDGTSGSGIRAPASRRVQWGHMAAVSSVAVDTL